MRVITRYLLPFFLTASILCGGTANAQKKGTSQPQPRKVLSAKEIAKATLPSVVLLVCDDANTEGMTQGSGFFIKPGILITNFHVIKGNKRGVVQVAFGADREKKTFRIARVIELDEDSDLALLSIPAAKTAKVPYLNLLSDQDSVEVGETVFALGNPEGLVGTISPGIISASLRSSQKKARLQITAPISSGSSGGPVVNDQGQVIGVVTSSFSEGQNLNFAVPSSLIWSLLKGAKFPSEFGDFVDTISDKEAKEPANWELPDSQVTLTASEGRGTGQGSGRGTGQGSGQGSGSGSGIGTVSGSENRSGPTAIMRRVTFISKPQPRYTAEARKNNIEGIVTLRITFLANGQIGAISPVKGLPFGLTAQAIAAARQIRFEPALKNGNPQTVTMNVMYTFTLF